MTLKSFLTAAVAVLTVGVLSMPAEVEAKRFGGGSSLGKQSSSMQRQAQPQRPAQQSQGQTQGQTQAAAAGQRPAATSGASRWLGPLAGLAAGGLLAALFFGDAFDGLQIMDFLLIALLVVGGFFLFRMLRRKQAGPAMATAGAGVGRGMPQAGAYERSAPGASGPFGGHGGAMHPGMGTQGGPSAGDDQAPTWLDRASFAQGAKGHFIRLQESWDKADFDDIREYTTPEMLAELQRERQKTAGGQTTEVVRLDAELVGVRREGDLVVASLLFSGLIREDAHGVAESFSEIWHVQHAWDEPTGDWLIAGIQQVEG